MVVVVASPEVFGSGTVATLIVFVVVVTTIIVSGVGVCPEAGNKNGA